MENTSGLPWEKGKAINSQRRTCCTRGFYYFRVLRKKRKLSIFENTFCHTQSDFLEKKKVISSPSVKSTNNQRRAALDPSRARTCVPLTQRCRTSRSRQPDQLERMTRKTRMPPLYDPFFYPKFENFIIAIISNK